MESKHHTLYGRTVWQNLAPVDMIDSSVYWLWKSLLISIVEYFAGLQPAANCTKCPKKESPGTASGDFKTKLVFCSPVSVCDTSEHMRCLADLFLNLGTQKARRFDISIQPGHCFTKLNCHGLNFPHHCSMCLAMSHDCWSDIALMVGLGQHAQRTIAYHQSILAINPPVEVFFGSLVVFHTSHVCSSVLARAPHPSTDVLGLLGTRIRISKVEEEKRLWTSACTRIIWEATDFTWILVAVPRSLTQQKHRKQQQVWGVWVSRDKPMAWQCGFGKNEWSQAVLKCALSSAFKKAAGELAHTSLYYFILDYILWRNDGGSPITSPNSESIKAICQQLHCLIAWFIKSSISTASFCWPLVRLTKNSCTSWTSKPHASKTARNAWQTSWVDDNWPKIEALPFSVWSQPWVRCFFFVLSQTGFGLL